MKTYEVRVSIRPVGQIKNCYSSCIIELEAKSMSQARQYVVKHLTVEVMAPAKRVNVDIRGLIFPDRK